MFGNCVQVYSMKSYQLGWHDIDFTAKRSCYTPSSKLHAWTMPANWSLSFVS